MKSNDLLIRLTPDAYLSSNKSSSGNKLLANMLLEDSKGKSHFEEMLFQQEEDEDVFEVEKLPFNEETRQSQ
jgi:hypothetical protein